MLKFLEKKMITIKLLSYFYYMFYQWVLVKHTVCDELSIHVISYDWHNFSLLSDLLHWILDKNLLIRNNPFSEEIQQNFEYFSKRSIVQVMMLNRLKKTYKVVNISIHPTINFNLAHLLWRVAVLFFNEKAPKISIKFSLV